MRFLDLIPEIFVEILECDSREEVVETSVSPKLPSLDVLEKEAREFARNVGIALECKDPKGGLLVPTKSTKSGWVVLGTKDLNDSEAKGFYLDLTGEADLDTLYSYFSGPCLSRVN